MCEKERPATSFFYRRPKKPAAGRDEHLDFGAPSLDADGQAVDETLTSVNIDNESKPAEVNDEVANNQATKDPVMLTTFSSHPSIKTFDPNRDISGKHCLKKAFLVILESSTALSSKQLVNPMLAKFFYKYVLHIHIYIAKTGTI